MVGDFPRGFLVVFEDSICQWSKKAIRQFAHVFILLCAATGENDVSLGWQKHITAW